jgi:hypothetical protein
MKGDIPSEAPCSDSISLSFKGIIYNRLDYEYHQSTGSFTNYHNTSVAAPIEFKIDMQLGLVYEPAPPSDFLVLGEPSSLYTDMNWRDLNQTVISVDGPHYLHYSEAHTGGYDTDTFYTHRVEFGNDAPFWFPDVCGNAWGNGNERVDLLYDYLGVRDLFSYKEHAYTAINWAPALLSPHLVRIGQVATGTLTLRGIEGRPEMIRCESST